MKMRGSNEAMDGFLVQRSIAASSRGVAHLHGFVLK